MFFVPKSISLCNNDLALNVDLLLVCYRWVDISRRFFI